MKQLTLAILMALAGRYAHADSSHALWGASAVEAFQDKPARHFPRWQPDELKDAGCRRRGYTYAQFISANESIGKFAGSVSAANKIAKACEAGIDEINKEEITAGN